PLRLKVCSTPELFRIPVPTIFKTKQAHRSNTYDVPPENCRLAIVVSALSTTVAGAAPSNSALLVGTVPPLQLAPLLKSLPGPCQTASCAPASPPVAIANAI